MNNKTWLDRTARLIGDSAMDKLAKSKVAVFGIGGVGSYAAEALVRSGVGALTFIDADIVDETNINRQLIAARNTIGMKKVDIMKERALAINPEVKVDALSLFYGQDSSDMIDLADFECIVDAIDTVTSKIFLIERAAALGVPIISAMGAGNKLDPTAFKVADIYSTGVCPLAKVMRRELRKRGVERLKVVYSTEDPISPAGDKRVPASIAFVPSVAGLILAGEVVKELIGYTK